MKANVTAKGYTNVILVLNMKRFIAEKDLGRFERLRGTREFAEILQHIWPEQALVSRRFETIADEKHHRNIDDEMSTEEVGFATGIFRTPMLEEFTFPTYAMNKDGFEFPQHLAENFQFKKLFMPAWKGWRIFIRPTFTGLFVIRLTRQYEKATPLMYLTHDVIRLQQSLDIQSARRRLVEVRTLYADQPDKLSSNENSILKFLEWLGADEKSSIRPLYAPVQWRLALEVCNLFVEQVGFSIPARNNPIDLIRPATKLSSLLHDSYVIYHLDEVWTNRHFIRNDRNTVSDMEDAKSEVPVETQGQQYAAPSPA